MTAENRKAMYASAFEDCNFEVVGPKELQVLPGKTFVARPTKTLYERLAGADYELCRYISILGNLSGLGLQFLGILTGERGLTQIGAMMTMVSVGYYFGTMHAERQYKKVSGLEMKVEEED